MTDEQYVVVPMYYCYSQTDLDGDVVYGPFTEKAANKFADDYNSEEHTNEYYGNFTYQVRKLVLPTGN
jgi:hypothetical protein